MDATRLEDAGTHSAAELGIHPPKGTPLPVRFASPYHPTRSVRAVCNRSEIGSRQRPPHLAPRRVRRSRHGCQVRVQFGDTRCEGTKLSSTLVLRVYSTILERPASFFLPIALNSVIRFNCQLNSTTHGLHLRRVGVLAGTD